MRKQEGRYKRVPIDDLVSHLSKLSDREEEIFFTSPLRAHIELESLGAKLKSSIEMPPDDLELKPLPKHLKYIFLRDEDKLPMIISSKLSEKEKTMLRKVLEKNILPFGWQNWRYQRH